MSQFNISLKYIAIAIIIGLSLQTSAQQLDKKEFKKLFLDAEYYFLYENYQNALDLYLTIYEGDSYQANYNYNLNYRIGYCYLMDPLQNYNAFTFLEKAAKSITLNYTDGSATEIQAPPEVFLVMGKAYKIVFEFDKAIYSFQKYEEYLDVSEVDIRSQLERNILSCRNAKDLLLLSEHNFVEAENLGDMVNTIFPEYNPIVSADENTLLFTARRNYNARALEKSTQNYDVEEDEVVIDEGMFDEDIYYAKRQEGKWLKPIKITAKIGADFQTRTSSLSADGTKLFLSRFEVGLGNAEVSNIYMSNLENGRWSKMEKLNKNINTKGFETNACLSYDSKTLYFTSDREGSYGGLDIYKSELDDEGEWGEPTNLGHSINTKFDEECPFILQDGKTLFFASQGHYNMGGFDIFYSKLIGDHWSVPINLGFPVNTMEDNIHYFPLEDGRVAYIALVANKGKGNEDLYKVVITSSIDFDKYTNNSALSLADIQDENKGEHKLQNKINNKEETEASSLLVFQFDLLETPTSLSSDEVIRTAFDDVDMLLDKARQLRKEANIAYLIAEEKNLLATDKRKEAEAILAAADTITDENQRRLELTKARQIQREADLLAIMAYNLAKRLDLTANEIEEYANESKLFAESLKQDGLKDAQTLAERLNENRKKMNEELRKYESLQAQLNSQTKILADKSRKLTFHQNKLSIVNEEIQIVKDTIESRRRIIDQLEAQIESISDPKEKEEAIDNRDQAVSELEYLVAQDHKLKEKQFNEISNYEKASREREVLDKKVTVLYEIDSLSKANQEPTDVLVEKATKAREGLKISSDEILTSLDIEPLMSPELVELTRSKLENEPVEKIAMLEDQISDNQHLKHAKGSDAELPEIVESSDSIPSATEVDSILVAENDSIADDGQDLQLLEDTVLLITETIKRDSSIIAEKLIVEENEEVEVDMVSDTIAAESNNSVTNDTIINNADTLNVAEVQLTEATPVVSYEEDSIKHIVEEYPEVEVSLASDTIVAESNNSVTNDTIINNADTLNVAEVQLTEATPVVSYKEDSIKLIVEENPDVEVSLASDTIVTESDNSVTSDTIINEADTLYVAEVKLTETTPVVSYKEDSIATVNDAQIEKIDEAGKDSSDALDVQIEVAEVEVGASDSSSDNSQDLTDPLIADTDSSDVVAESASTDPAIGEPKLIEVKGAITLQDNNRPDKSFRISYSQNEHPAQIFNVNPEIPSGRFSFYVEPGSYKLVFVGDGYKKKDEFIDIPESYTRSSLVLNAELIPVEVASGEYFVTKAIFFDFDKSALTRDAKIELEELYKLMTENTGLYFEVVGYTDSKGDLEYNNQLSKRRARSTVDYLVNRGIQKNRFVAKGIGESDFIAINVNPDGSDNPEGRKYNRRVEIKILNSTSATIISKDITIPNHLRASESATTGRDVEREGVTSNDLVYSVQLKALRTSTSLDYFSNLTGVKETIGKDNIYRYTYGAIKGYEDARKELLRIQELGYEDAFLVRQNAPETANNIEELSGNYTIQIKALLKKAESDVFGSLKNVSEHYCKDGFIRYSYGSYSNIKEARKELQSIKKQGYPDAFIISSERYNDL